LIQFRCKQLNFKITVTLRRSSPPDPIY